MSVRRRWPIAAALLVLLGAALALLWHRGQRSTDTGDAQAVIDEARARIAGSRRLNRALLAEREFARAEEAIEQAEALLDGGDRTALMAAAETALRLADAARAKADERQAETQAALLAEMSGSVVHRAATRVVWADAVRGMSLLDGDRIGTGRSSAAVLRFRDAGDVRVAEESIVVVRRPIERRADDLVDLDLKLTRGLLDTMTVDAEARSALVAADLRAADIVVRSGPVQLVRAAVTPVLDAPIAVMKGSASIEAPSGETIVLEPSSYTLVSPEGDVSEARPLPGKPRGTSPHDGATVLVSRDRPEVALGWDADGCEQVRVELASDLSFARLLRSETLQRSQLVLPELSPGDYFWRLRCLDLAALQEAPVEALRFAVVGDSEPPRLEVVAPAAKTIVTTATVVARCRTEPSLRVFINGAPASELAPGEYGRRVELAPGLNRLVFEAIDGAGNAGRARHYVTRAVN